MYDSWQMSALWLLADLPPDIVEEQLGAETVCVAGRRQETSYKNTHSKTARYVKLTTDS